MPPSLQTQNVAEALGLRDGQKEWAVLWGLRYANRGAVFFFFFNIYLFDASGRRNNLQHARSSLRPAGHFLGSRALWLWHVASVAVELGLQSTRAQQLWLSCSVEYGI